MMIFECLYCLNLVYNCIENPASLGDKLRYKAQLVANGYNQILGVNYTYIFSLVIKHSSILILLGYVVSSDYELEQLDVTTIFINSVLEEEIHMQQHEGFIVHVKKNYVRKLKKSLYHASSNIHENSTCGWHVHCGKINEGG